MSCIKIKRKMYQFDIEGNQVLKMREFYLIIFLYGCCMDIG